MNQRNKSNTVFVLEIIYTPQLFQNMIGRSYMLTHLFQNIQNAQFHKQRGENSSGGSSSSQSK